jgi:hypothetical protein
MPVFTQGNMSTHTVGGSAYGFSARRIEDLGASEYTLGLIIVDVSGSVSGFRGEIEAAVKEVVRSCRHSPRADNMMLRLVIFDDTVTEVHGYKPLTECNEDDYTDVIQIGGMTALYDATYNGILSATQYGLALTKQDFDVNAAVFVVTDGMDNRSKMDRRMVADAFQGGVTSESLESIVSVLIGVNTQSGGLNDYLRELKKEAGFTQYVSIGKATAKELAKLGGFVSKSISSQSQALGSGSAGQSLSF